MAHKLEYLLDFCNTDLQRRVVQMFIEGRTGPEIAQASGMVHRSGPDTMLRRIKKRAARSGHAPGHFEHGVAPGFAMGKVTVQRGADGSVERVWERQHPEALESLLEALDERLHLSTIEAALVAFTIAFGGVKSIKVITGIMWKIFAWFVDKLIDDAERAGRERQRAQILIIETEIENRKRLDETTDQMLRRLENLQDDQNSPS